MQLRSSAFQQGSPIPSRFTCDGENTSPDLSWEDVPPETKSFALIMHDPDAPRQGGFTHWILFNIPATVTAIQPNVPAEASVAGVGVQGKNDAGKVGYMGPCPPSGTHRYFLRVYALDTDVSLRPGASLEQLQEAMRGHILDEAELMGTYARASRRAA